MGTRTFVSGVTLAGLDLSGVDADGLDWVVEEPKGWGGSPASRLDLTPRAADHGAWPSPRPRLAARTVVLAGTITGPAGLVADAVDRLHMAASLDPVRLDVTEASGRTRWAMVQRSDEVDVDDTIAHHVRYSVQLAQPDPLKYGAEQLGMTGMPVTSGGLAVPAAVPFAVGSTVVSGQVALDNPGNAAGPVRLRIDGPIAGPVVTHTGGGVTTVLALSLTLAAGEWLDIDTRRKTVLANGTANRAGWITSRGWSRFRPGGNTWALTAPTYSPSARLTVIGTPAWR